MAEVTYFGVGPANGFATPDSQLTNQTASRAEVSFQGTTPASTPLGDSEIVPNKVSQADVINEGIPASYGLGESTVVITYSPTQAPSDLPVVELYSEPLPTPWSTNPNDNEVVLSPTGAASNITFTVVNPANAFDQNGLAYDPGLDRMNGANGLVGKRIIFGTATGGLQSALVGATGTIAAHTNNTITLAVALSSIPTNTDQFTIIEIDRILRKSPVIEVILE